MSGNLPPSRHDLSVDRIVVDEDSPEYDKQPSSDSFVGGFEDALRNMYNPALAGAGMLYCPVCGQNNINWEGFDHRAHGSGTCLDIRYRCHSNHRFAIRQDFVLNQEWPHFNAVYLAVFALPDDGRWVPPPDIEAIEDEEADEAY